MTAQTVPDESAPARIRWQDRIESVQCRAWVWRYKMDNRTHHLGGTRMRTFSQNCCESILSKPL